MAYIFRICRIGPHGALELSPLTLSPEAAQKSDPVAFLKLYEEMQRVVKKQQKIQIEQLTLMGLDE